MSTDTLFCPLIENSTNLFGGIPNGISASLDLLDRMVERGSTYKDFSLSAGSLNSSSNRFEPVRRPVLSTLHPLIRIQGYIGVE